MQFIAHAAHRHVMEDTATTPKEPNSVLLIIAGVLVVAAVAATLLVFFRSRNK